MAVFSKTNARLTMIARLDSVAMVFYGRIVYDFVRKTEIVLRTNIVTRVVGFRAFLNAGGGVIQMTSAAIHEKSASMVLVRLDVATTNNAPKG
jgi:hypothetical protein